MDSPFLGNKVGISMSYERARRRIQHCKTQADEGPPKDQEFLDALERS